MCRHRVCPKGFCPIVLWDIYLQGASARQFCDNEVRLCLSAAAQELDHVGVVELSHHVHLRHEFPEGEVVTLLQHFHRHVRLVPQRLVDRSKLPRPQLFSLLDGVLVNFPKLVLKKKVLLVQLLGRGGLGQLVMSIHKGIKARGHV